MPTAQLADGPFSGRDLTIDAKDTTVLIGEVAGRLQVLLGPDLDRAPQRAVYALHAEPDRSGRPQPVWRHVERNQPEWWREEDDWMS